MAEMHSRIRVAVLLDSAQVEPWQQHLLTGIHDDDVCEIVGVLHGDVAVNATAGVSSSFANAINSLEKRIANWLFRRVFGASRKATAAMLPVRDVCPDVTVHAGCDSAVAIVKVCQSLNLDALIDLRSGSVESEMAMPLDAARAGVWSLQLGVPLDRQGIAVPAGFAEVANNQPNTYVQLVARKVAHGATGLSHDVLLEGTYRTFLWSWHENERQLRFKAGLLFRDALRWLADAGETACETTPARHQVSVSARPAGSSIGGGALLRALMRCWWRIGRELFERIVREENWRPYVGHGSAADFDPEHTQALDGPPESYWADPFPVMRDGRRYVFFEAYPYATRKGVIAVAEYGLDDSGVSVGPARTVIEQDGHMSYPFLFEHNGTLYMVPETSASKRIDVWRCETFPYDWRHEHTLMDGVSATDTTLVEHEGRWWMFTNIDRSGLGDHCSELHVFHADDPLAGSWTPHAQNPVVRDAGSARMAGAIYRDGNGLVRPAQVNAHYYGEALTFQRIVRLDAERYEEEQLHRIEPNWRPGIYRNHHVSAHQGHVMIDACHNQFRLVRWWKTKLAKRRAHATAIADVEGRRADQTMKRQPT